MTSAILGNDLIDTLYRVKNKIGTSLLHEKLKEIESLYSDDYPQMIREAVIKEVCDMLEVRRQDVLKREPQKRHERHSMALDFICAILSEYCKFDLKEIGIIFDYSVSNISRRITYIKKLDRMNKIDIQTAVLYDEIVNNLITKKLIKKI